jgi:hypothetical protein
VNESRFGSEKEEGGSTRWAAGRQTTISDTPFFQVPFSIKKHLFQFIYELIMQPGLPSVQM